MQIQELPLYPTQELIPNSSLEQNNVSTPPQSIHPLKPQVTLENILKDIFPQTKEENTIIKIRKLLGQTAENLSDEQIHCIVAEFQFLINGWLDEFEREVFGGLTLKEVLNEK